MIRRPVPFCRPRLKGRRDPDACHGKRTRHHLRSPADEERAHDRQGHHPGRGIGLAPVPADQVRQQAVDGRLRQAHDLFSAVHADARRHPPGARHHDPARAAALPPLARRRPSVGAGNPVRRAARTRRARAGVHHRPGILRRLRLRARPRRQHLLRHESRGGPARRRLPASAARRSSATGSPTRRLTGSRSSRPTASASASRRSRRSRRATTP